MSTTPQSTKPSRATLDRRLRARRSLPALAYIDLGENNGGIVLNLSEGGLAVMAAAPLDIKGPVRMRFQLPGSRDRLEAFGEITWISGSKKEAGLHFVDLAEEGRSRITAWMSSEQSLPLNSKTSAISAAKARPAELRPTHPAKNAVAEFVGTSKATPEGVQISAGAIETDIHPPVGEELLPNHAPSEGEAVSRDLSAQKPLAPSDRRLHRRRRVPSLAYIDLGENNGGIILNLSEGGLAVASAAPLYAEGRAEMQFQLPGSDNWLKVGGEVAWISKSKKEAGLRFLELSDHTRDQMIRWISSQTSKVKSESEETGTREKVWRRLEMPTIPVPPASANRDRTAAATVAPLLGATTAATFHSSDLGSGSRSAATTDQGISIAAEERKSLLKRTWATLALIVVLAALASFLAGWFTAAPSPLSRVLAWFGRIPSNTGETTNVVGAPEAGTVAGVSDSPVQNASAPAVRPTEVSNTDSVNPPQSGEGELAKHLTPSENTSTVGTVAHAVNPLDQVRKPSPPGARPSVLVSRSGVAPQLGSQSAAITTTPSPIVSPVQGTSSAGQASSLSAKPAQPIEIVKPSFSVNFNPYPSVRVPTGFKSQQGARLEIGRLLSRVDPVYPEDAEAQRVEGTVKLHVIIGLDGSVRSFEPISGPALLIPAAENAVRQWRYTESSIGDQLVETEEDITISFRLVTEMVHPN